MPRLEGDAVKVLPDSLQISIFFVVAEFRVSCMQFLFVDDVRTIVEGETKFSKIGQLSANEGKSVDVKARDLQHLFLAMTKEVGPSHFVLIFEDSSLHILQTLVVIWKAAFFLTSASASLISQQAV